MLVNNKVSKFNIKAITVYSASDLHIKGGAEDKGSALRYAIPHSQIPGGWGGGAEGGVFVNGRQFFVVVGAAAYRSSCSKRWEI